METLRGSLVGAALESLGAEEEGEALAAHGSMASAEEPETDAASVHGSSESASGERARHLPSEAGVSDANYGTGAGASVHGGAGSLASGGGKCPFTGVVNDAFVREASPERELVWTPEALERLERIPSFIRPLVEKGIVEYAREKGVAEIDGAVMDEARQHFGM